MLVLKMKKNIQNYFSNNKNSIGLNWIILNFTLYNFSNIDYLYFIVKTKK